MIKQSLIVDSNHIPNVTAKHLGKMDDLQLITTTWIVNTKKINNLNEIKNFCKQYNLTIKKEIIMNSLPLVHLKIVGTSKNYELALQVNLNSYSDIHESANYEYIGTSTPIKIPKEFADTLNIIGLNTNKIAHPYFKKIDNKNQTRALTTFNPLQLATLYNFPQNLNGAGQKIGIIQLGGGYVLSDITTYFSQLGINATPNITSVSVDGGINNPNDPSGASVEVILDTEIIAALVPAATIRVYFAPNSFQGFYDAIAAAINDNCAIISISWGLVESGWGSSNLNTYNNLFKYASTKNITILAASGDFGSSDGASGNNTDFPSSSPYVIACGGTNLKTINDVTISQETTWTGSGGGISKTFVTPSYQSNIPSNLLSGMRGSPDVAGVADPSTGHVIYSAREGGWFVVGGTSAVSPLFSGLLGRINQSLGTNVGFLHPFLYSTTNIYNDITTGNNGAFSAIVGWDKCTGFGSFDGTKLLNALANITPTPDPIPETPISVVAAFTATPLTGTGSLNCTFTDQSTGTPTSWLWNFGDNTNTSTLQNPVHMYTKSGVFTVSLKTTNSSSTNTLTKTSYITVNTNSKPIANFTATPLSGRMPLRVQFTDTSTGSPSRWQWIFGNGTTSTLRNPVCNYTRRGTYTVKLSVLNAYGSTSLTKTRYINVV